MAATNDRPATTATEYVVLEQREFKDDSSGEVTVAWVESGHTTGTTRNGVVLEIAGDKEGIWRPVPTRNWADAIRTREEVSRKMKAEPVEPF
jgi:hypothetical protein